MLDRNHGQTGHRSLIGIGLSDNYKFVSDTLPKRKDTFKIVFDCILLYLTVLSVMQATVMGSSVVVVVKSVVVSVSLLLVVSDTFSVVSS